jgi:hypothetical protein
MLSGVYRFPAMESVVFGKPFARSAGAEGRSRRGMMLSLPH